MVYYYARLELLVERETSVVHESRDRVRGPTQHNTLAQIRNERQLMASFVLGRISGSCLVLILGGLRQLWCVLARLGVFDSESTHFAQIERQRLL